MGGDFNAKHTFWGSRLSTTKGRELYKAMRETGCECISTGSPTYWPTDRAKTPDLIDFFIIKKISRNYLEIKEGFDLNSDHSPIYLTFNRAPQEVNSNPKLTNKNTDWKYYKQLINENTTTDKIINSSEDLEVEVQQFTALIQRTAWACTPDVKKFKAQTTFPSYIKNLINEKRKLRKKWQESRYRHDKNQLNKATKKLKREIEKFENRHLSDYLAQLTYNSKTDYSLWKASKNLQRPETHKSAIKANNGEWVKTDMQKATLFAEYLASIFSPDTLCTQHLEAVVNNDEETLSFTSVSELKREIRNLNSKKSPGYDLITGDLLKHLPHRGVVKLSRIFNAAINLTHVPSIWKLAEIVMIQKPGKPSENIASYRPISLLPLIGKLFEKILSRRLKEQIHQKGLLPNHQFGFRERHSTIQQIHRITHEIEIALEKKEVCSAVFLDISKAFDAVWHEGLLHKLNMLLPKHYYKILKSYLEHRAFRVRQANEYSEIYPINSGVPQGSILGPVLYLLFTNDMPVNINCIVGTFADDTVILSTEKNEAAATQKLQTAVLEFEQWTKRWGIKINSSKSIHMYFTNRKTYHVPIYIDQIEVPFSNSAKYLGMTLDVKLRWKEHVKKKRTELELKYRNLSWLMDRNSKLSQHNKLMLYKQILKPIWTYGIQLWGCANNTVISTIQKFQNKVLRNIVKAPWYIRNSDIHRDLHIPTVKEEITKNAETHMMKLMNHTNEEIPILLNTSHLVRRLNRHKPNDLIYRFS